jgi:acyl-CoA synthetase (AMP-forming)/AMP-acid ligase II
MLDCAGGDPAAEGFEAYDEVISQHEPAEVEDGPIGDFLLYSSGTTGKPKGIKRPLSNRPVSKGMPIAPALASMFAMDAETVYLAPAPLYHSAPIAFAMGVQCLGGTVVLMESFDALDALRALEAHGVTHSQWVPTMFTRMLKLPREERESFDLSRHEVAVHAAAPCPRSVKQQMMDWWGPILHEYYGGTETGIATYIGPEDWLAHPGSVGRATLRPLHVCDEAGHDLAAGEPGLIYIELAGDGFEYHKAPDKTRSSRHPLHPSWVELGDVGYLDEDGFLFLTDRASFMIISGGVNIYPQEIENELIVHPKVADVAVIGVPNDEFGEEVKAIVQPVAGVPGDEALTEELMRFARDRLAHYKCPRSIDYEPELPRLPTGKLYKRLLKERYWAGAESGILAEQARPGSVRPADGGSGRT